MDVHWLPIEYRIKLKLSHHARCGVGRMRWCRANAVVSGECCGVGRMLWCRVNAVVSGECCGVGWMPVQHLRSRHFHKALTSNTINVTSTSKNRHKSLTNKTKNKNNKQTTNKPNKQNQKRHKQLTSHLRPTITVTNYWRHKPLTSFPARNRLRAAFSVMYFKWTIYVHSSRPV